jgi:hypothetical protein
LLRPHTPIKRGVTQQLGCVVMARARKKIWEFDSKGLKCLFVLPKTNETWFVRRISENLNAKKHRD